MFNAYGGTITGLVIREREIGEFLKKYVECHPEDFESDILHEKMDAVFESIQCERRIKSSSGDEEIYVQEYDEDVFYDTASIYSLCDTNDWHEPLKMPFLLVEADKFLLTKNVLEGKYYSSKEELILEFKDKVGRYLPEDFDYEGSIGDVEYAVACV